MSTTSQPQSQTVKLDGDLFSPFFLSSILLSSLYWAWMFLLYWSSTLNAPLLGDPMALLSSRGCATLGAALALLVMATLHRKREKLFPHFVSKGATALAMAATPVITLAFVLGFPATLEIVCLCWFISGIGSAYLLVQIGKMLARYRTESATVLQFIALILAVAICLLTLQQPALVREIAMLVLSCAGVITGWWCTTLQGEKALISTPAATDKASANCYIEPAGSNPAAQEIMVEEEKLAPILKKTIVISLIQMLLYSTMFGLCLGVGAVIIPDTPAANFIWVSLTFAGIALMAYATWLNKYVQYNWFLCGLFAFAGIAIVPLGQLSLDSPIRYALCLLLCFGFTTFDLIELWRLSRVASMQQVSFSRLFSLGRFANAIGLFFGFALAYASLTAAADPSAQLVWSTLIPGAILLALGITIVISIKDSLIDIAIVPEPEQAETKSIQTKRAWRTACDDLCREHELSPREAEVFKLMTRGRDAGYICEALFISNHTVKSHIYHIYQKLDIHSQQELITMVEKRSRAVTEA